MASSVISVPATGGGGGKLGAFATGLDLGLAGFIPSPSFGIEATLEEAFAGEVVDNFAPVLEAKAFADAIVGVVTGTAEGEANEGLL